ncbi:hypothetical protein UFOVP97_34 [uncultured Caudovirales phage]|uniref:Uncharacterized protein n=1 Tax=uncultured Caudovirales phage TaxID=2100421 RepID=A0A6J5L262_9CAUD|nr:hypothetical protein UFOVP97_34 [uncultured Caudovirales phage]CAB4134388.1 hypothetical protein UFOVP268_52 [uncultured Caudovirales phage]
MSQIQSFLESAGPGPGPVLSLTGDLGGPVGPDGLGNINILGENVPSSGFAQIIGNPLTNTLNVQPLVSDLSTNDGSFHTIYTLPLAANTSAVLYALVVGEKTDLSVCVGGLITGVARRQGAGAATGPGSNGLISTDYVGNPAPTVIMVPSGNSLVVQVRGVAGSTYDWTCQIIYQFEIL